LGGGGLAVVFVRAISQERKLRRRNSKGSANKGYGAKEEETPEKPYPREKFRKQGNGEMRRKSANAI